MSDLTHIYAARYGGRPHLVKSPGRVNLIGEHTDYNQGYVLPAAIDKFLFFAFGNNPEPGKVRFYSIDFEEEVQFDLADFATEKKASWQGYLENVVAEMLDRGYAVRGLQGVFGGNIPLGAGLSSSAALCCGLITGIADLSGLHIPKQEIALIAQAAEHRVGLNCGLMDQYASLFGKNDHALLLDCKSLQFEYLPVHLPGCALVLLNSGIKHTLAAGSGYNDRRHACETVVKAAQQIAPAVTSLRDVDEELLSRIRQAISATEHRRAAYVLAENHRVLLAAEALLHGDLTTFGRLLSESHEGLRHEYEVTVPETDLLADLAQKEHAVLGARQVGGGFGGCMLLLMKKEGMADALARISAAYAQETGITAGVIPVGLRWDG